MSGLAWTLAHARANNPFFRRLIDGAGVDPASVTSPADLARLPLTDKDSLREAFPLGWLCVPEAEVVRIHASTGTTGQRVVVAYTAEDLRDWTQMFARCYRYAGVTPADRVQVTPAYGLWTAGSGFQAGAEEVGAMVVPTGPGNLDLQFEMALALGSTVLTATASFALLIAEEAERRGLSDRLSFRIGIFGSERWGDAMRSRINRLLNVDSYDIYGFTELYGPGAGIDCHLHQGIHVWADHFVVEVIDPQTGEVLPEGKEGELVVTTLRKQAMPLIRYRTRDLSRLIPEPCPCGSPHPRIERITGRSDDMFKVRGVNVFPAQVDRVLAGFEEMGSEYQVRLWREAGRERFLIRVESGAGPEIARRVADRLRQALGVRPEVELVAPGTLPRTDRKTRRVFDERDSR